MSVYIRRIITEQNNQILRNTKAARPHLSAAHAGGLPRSVESPKRLGGGTAGSSAVSTGGRANYPRVSYPAHLVSGCMTRMYRGGGDELTTLVPYLKPNAIGRRLHGVLPGYALRWPVLAPAKGELGEE